MWPHPSFRFEYFQIVSRRPVLVSTDWLRSGIDSSASALRHCNHNGQGGGLLDWEKAARQGIAEDGGGVSGREVERS